MAATPIAATERYYRPGKTLVYFLPTAADYTAPTRPEMDAGQDLSGEIASIDGWQVTSATLPTPDLRSAFTPKIGGEISADDSSLTFWADARSVDVRRLFTRATTGIILMLDEGDVPGYMMDSYPVYVTATPKLRSLSDPAQIQVTFAITKQPEENVTIPA